MEIYELHDRQFKVTTVKMLSELRRVMHEQKVNSRKKILKFTEEPNRYLGAKKCSNWAAKCKKIHQQTKQAEKEISELKDS